MQTEQVNRRLPRQAGLSLLTYSILCELFAELKKTNTNWFPDFFKKQNVQYLCFPVM